MSWLSKLEITDALITDALMISVLADDARMTEFLDALIPFAPGRMVE